ncbi:MAG: hypothetical protein DWB56_15130 [Candidatus Jettenia sp.]|nr:MAG: hypothetical protein EDM77_14595 [Candidatus Jettenia sp. AMX1]MBC6930264.1 hypothetical protein [Candidatus Jettenia sp.]MCE7881825.1 hypothetical protein [Candidatus Jettenia sp. AMX1]MCQ3927138.1 hypothetical protein [Candidatus Jettenia sp.]MDL1940278.1 DNA-directed RNA polymerase subunit omega [Candidatus Jettenia sp. AMX1]
MVYIFWNIYLIKGVIVNYKYIDNLAKQVGGSLRLTALIISRSRQIVKKAPILIETNIDDPVQIAFLELMQGKIRLNEGGAPPPQVSEQKKIEKLLGTPEKSEA